MSEFIVAFKTDNAAFDGLDGDQEIARILRAIADSMDGTGQSANPYGTPNRIRDINGNRVGYWAWGENVVQPS